MTLDDLRAICKTLPDVTEDIKWGHDLCFCVGGKIFFITGLDENPPTGCFKTDEENFEGLCERKGFKPAPYLAKFKWVYVENASLVSGREWKQFIEQSYALIKSKLPASKSKKKAK